MSDFENGGKRASEPTCILKMEFEGQELPWLYPLALNGRTITHISIGGVTLKEAKTCTVEETYAFVPGTHIRECRLSCGHYADTNHRFCPRCGAEVVG